MFLFKGIQNRYFIIQMLLSFFFKMSYVFEYIIVFGEENTKIKRIHCLDQSMYIWVSCRRYYNLPRKLSELTINSLAITLDHVEYIQESRKCLSIISILKDVQLRREKGFFLFVCSRSVTTQGSETLSRRLSDVTEVYVTVYSLYLNCVEFQVCFKKEHTSARSIHCT